MSKKLKTERKAMTIEQQDAFRAQLVSESPKIDEALKSFCSWMAATYSNQYTIAQVLQSTRILSKAINQHVFPIQPTTSRNPQQIMIAAQVWNQVVAAQQKPTKFLGKTALQLAWNDLEGTNTIDEFYWQEFERLLFVTEDDPDAQLIWSSNAPQELARRATERKAQATRRIQQEQEQQEIQTPMIEELDDE